MKAKRWTAIFVVLSVIWAVCIPAASAADTKTGHGEVYVAFGDSITLGFEPGAKEDFIPYGYVDRLYEQALYRGRAIVSNYAIGGLTTKGLDNMIQAVAGLKQVKGSDIQPRISDPRADAILANVKQIRDDVAAATLITITIGGNDFGATIADKVAGMSESELKAFMDEQLKTYSDHLTSVLNHLYVINKQVRIYVADQYSPYPKINKELYERLQKMKDQFSATLKTVEKSFRDQNYNMHAVSIADSFVGSEGNYLHIAVRDIHPKQSGYELIAGLFARAIWGEYLSAADSESDEAIKAISIIVSGKTVHSPHRPVLLEDTTFVPLREYSEALGAVVEWNSETQTATVRMNGRSVAMTIDSKAIVVNDKTQPIDLPPRFLESAGESKTYIPLRLMAEGLGFDVKYVLQSHTAYINP